MEINIEANKVETDDINLITFDGTILPARKIFYDGHIVVCKQDGRKIRCFKNYGLTLSQLEEILTNISSDISKMGTRNFTLLADRFLINNDNMQQLHFKSNLLGLHLVEAEFRDGQIVELYKGCNEEYAINLIQEYEKNEKKYVNQEHSDGSLIKD